LGPIETIADDEFVADDESGVIGRDGRIAGRLHE
jgi:hypothetical protein